MKQSSVRNIFIHEVGSWDGFQVEKVTVPLEEKIRWIDGSFTAGVDVIQLGSFVHPAKVPQFESALGGLGGCPLTRLSAGNIFAEDLVHTLPRMGLWKDIRLDSLHGVARQVRTCRDRELPGFILKSGSIVDFQGQSIDRKKYRVRVSATRTLFIWGKACRGRSPNNPKTG